MNGQFAEWTHHPSFESMIYNQGGGTTSPTLHEGGGTTSPTLRRSPRPQKRKWVGGGEGVEGKEKGKEKGEEKGKEKGKEKEIPRRMSTRSMSTRSTKKARVDDDEAEDKKESTADEKEADGGATSNSRPRRTRNTSLITQNESFCQVYASSVSDHVPVFVELPD
jgi:hypothetical protein